MSFLLDKGWREEAVKQVEMIVEGIEAFLVTLQLTEKYKVSMPIAEAINAVVNEGLETQKVVSDLMGRDKRSEINTTINQL